MRQDQAESSRSGRPLRARFERIIDLRHERLNLLLLEHIIHLSDEAVRESGADHVDIRRRVAHSPTVANPLFKAADTLGRADLRGGPGDPANSVLTAVGRYRRVVLRCLGALLSEVGITIPAAINSKPALRAASWRKAAPYRHGKSDLGNGERALLLWPGSVLEEPVDRASSTTLAEEGWLHWVR